jgi:hypothetical protein
MDDLAAALRPLPEQMARMSEAVDRLTDEVRSMRGDLRSLRGDLSGSQRQIAHIGWALSAALIGAVVALLVALV